MTENRLAKLLEAECERKHPRWKLVDFPAGWVLLSPVEPCHQCGTPIFLIAKPPRRPVWVELGEMKDEGTLFPTCRMHPHRCRDHDLVDVEAALLHEVLAPAGEGAA